jgi:hypothetical protein
MFWCSVGGIALAGNLNAWFFCDGFDQVFFGRRLKFSLLEFIVNVVRDFRL